MKRSIRLSVIGLLTSSCVLLFAPAGAVAQQASNDQAILTLNQVKEQLKQNKQYLNHAKKSAKAGDAQGLDTALNNYNRGMEGLNTALSHGDIQGTPSQQQDAYHRVQLATQKHIDVLDGLLSKVPAQAVPHIQHAIDVSQTGQKTALSHLSQLQTQQAMGQANRPGIGQAGGVGRSGGMGGFGSGTSSTAGPSLGASMGRAGGPPAGVGGGHGR